ncbi:type II secretion system F family protein [Photobacterium ganghwense]|uniref:type II secretion system F family protein n=1 Tax=Photobacterium ganghwense TaxID=320778 RepID=UPI00069EBBA9|nr:type II secretion system F family protein [Photobacterium ganghwense]PSU08188.1 type II secretion system F family protein [Photobacterium ganghwense]QSV14997.1 type II secretion system F family protein [Photobacterium ganghwense]
MWLSLSVSTGLFISGLVLLVLAAGLFLWSVRQQRIRRVEQNLAQRLGKTGRREAVIQQSQALWSRTKRQKIPSLAEVQQLLRKAGYISNREQTLCLMKLLVTWLLIQLLVVIPVVQGQIATEQMLSLLVISLAGGLYGALQWLKQKVAQRSRIIDEELVVGLQMMKTLWDVGLSLESILRAYCRELGNLTPELTKEMQLALNKIEAGQERSAVFSVLARSTDSQGLQDVLTMFAQVSDSGGSLSTSLTQLTLLLRDRRRTQLQEKVTKLSGRMSVVMMIFLFPALFVVLAGPGMIALSQAIGF